MPTYEYHCPNNGQTLEVRHKMSEKLETWGELCERGGFEQGDTPTETPIQRNILGGLLMLKSSGITREKMMQQAAESKTPAPASGGCCGGRCGGHSSTKEKRASNEQNLPNAILFPEKKSIAILIHRLFVHIWMSRSGQRHYCKPKNSANRKTSG